MCCIISKAEKAFIQIFNLMRENIWEFFETGLGWTPKQALLQLDISICVIVYRGNKSTALSWKKKVDLNYMQVLIQNGRYKW